MQANSCRAEVKTLYVRFVKKKGGKLILNMTKKSKNQIKIYIQDFF